MRWLVPLLLFAVLVGCPAPEDGPPGATETGSAASPFATTYKGKAAEGAQRDTEDAESEETEAPTLVAVDRQATVRDTRDGFLYLREGPSSQTAALAQMPNGSSVGIGSCQPGAEGSRWCQTAFDGRDGWAHESGLDYVARPSSPREVAAPRSAIVADPDGWTNLRAEPSTSAEATRVVSGTPVTVHVCTPPGNGSRSRWCEVTAHPVSGDLAGWIAESRLRYE